jgi:hypothetical protein
LSIDPVIPVAPAVPPILAEHLEELGYLATRRRKLLFSERVRAVRMPFHEERIEAHLDALVIGGDTSSRIARETLADGEPWEVVAAARFLIRIGEVAPRTFLELVLAADDEHMAAWREALRQSERDRVVSVLPDTLTEDLPAGVRAICMDAWLWHGLKTELALASDVPDLPPEVRRTVARHLGWIPGDPSGATAQARRLLEDDDTATRRRALFSVALRDAGAALQVVRQSLRGTDVDPFSLRILGLFGQAADVDSLHGFIEHEALGTPAVLALGDLGVSRAVPLLIARMEREQPDAEHMAGSDGVIPDDDESSPTQLAIERIVGEIPDDGKAAAGVAEKYGAYWREHEADFAGDERWLRGVRFPLEQRDAGSMEAAWLEAVLSDDGNPGLYREVPDGFFTGLNCDQSIPGE